ncbi:MAG TPA: hypothetical protein VLX61_08775 [Anaerolineales bacterium]|nr:hypothetical protein [Anaerolineales bacterium]
MPQELQNLLVTLNLIIISMFAVIAVIIVTAYLYEIRRSREYEQSRKQLINDGRYESEILILLEKYSLWTWLFALLVAAISSSVLSTEDPMRVTTSGIIFGIITVILTFTNIFTKRSLRKKMIDATTDFSQQGK